jgi:hypothetical protein
MTELTERQKVLQERERFKKWRDRSIAGLPALSKRVFALRKKMYMGCGFHWSLEKELGMVIFDLSNYDKYPDTMLQICMEVNLAHLYKEVAKAEKSAEEHIIQGKADKFKI